VDPITGAVVIAGLKYVGKPSAELVKDFLGKILAPTGEAVGTAIAHPIVEWQKRRIERGQKVVEEAAVLVESHGAEPDAVPGRVLLPLLEKASVEEDEDLRQQWVALLANASMTPENVLPAFIAILGELSPVEARLLSRLLLRFDLPSSNG
jgi:hypothetical protein